MNNLPYYNENVNTASQTAPVFGTITYSDEIEERIADLESQLAYYREAYNQLYKEKKFIDQLFEVEAEKLTTGHKATIHATVRYLRDHERERDERGYIKIDAYQVAHMAGHSYGTVLNHWGATSREMRIREGFEVEADIGRVPVFDRLVVRVPTTDRERYPQGYYLETYLKERDILYEPEHYRPQTPIEWGGKRKDAGRKKCRKCNVWMKAKDHIRTAQREHICPNCHRHEWDETRIVSDEVPPTSNNDDLINEPVEPDEASKNQVDFCYLEPEIEASKGQLDEVYPSPLLHQVDSTSPPVVNTVSALEELQALPVWCCHRGKVPYNVSRMVRDFQKAKPNDPATWTTYDQAQAIYQESQGWAYPFDGIGMMNNGAYTFVDLDRCRDKETGELSVLAQDTIALLDSYTELSQSETGVHIIVRGSIPNSIKRPEIELYNHHRFFVWTGKHLEGTPEMIADRRAELHSLYQELTPAQEYITPLAPAPEQFTCARSESEILELARNARNGAKFTALYGGDWSGYHSQSEADQALFEMLLYWTDGNVSTSCKLFEKSGLMRDKWKRDDYRERTIKRALGLQERRAS